MAAAIVLRQSHGDVTGRRDCVAVLIVAYRRTRTAVRLGRHGPISKHNDGYFQFQRPKCTELRATVNPRNNLAHCFGCRENVNNIELMIIAGLEFLMAVENLKNWLEEYERDLKRKNPETQPVAN